MRGLRQKKKKKKKKKKKNETKTIFHSSSFKNFEFRRGVTIMIIIRCLNLKIYDTIIFEDFHDLNNAGSNYNPPLFFK